MKLPELARTYVARIHKVYIYIDETQTKMKTSEYVSVAVFIGI